MTDVLIEAFKRWFPKFEREAGPFSVGDWGVYPDFVYKNFFEEHPHLRKTFEKMVNGERGGMEGWAAAVIWLHRASGCDIETSKFIIYLPKEKKKHKYTPVHLR